MVLIFKKRILKFDPDAPSETSSTGSIHVSFKTLVRRVCPFVCSSFIDRLLLQPRNVTATTNRRRFARSFFSLWRSRTRFYTIAEVCRRCKSFLVDTFDKHLPDLLFVQGLQGGYGFLSFKTEQENKNAVEVCLQRVINDVIFDCQWSEKNVNGKDVDRTKSRGERISPHKVPNASVDRQNRPHSEHHQDNGAKNGQGKKERTIRSSSNASSKVLREEAAQSAPHIAGPEPQVAVPAPIAYQGLPYIMQSLPIAHNGFSGHPVHSIAPHYPQGYMTSPPQMSYGASPMQTAEGQHVAHRSANQIQQQFPPPQYVYSSASNSTDIHQSPGYVYHQQQLSPTMSPNSFPSNGISPRSSHQHSPIPSSVPHPYIVPMTSNAPPPPMHSVPPMPSSPYPVGIRPDERSTSYGVLYNNHQPYPVGPPPAGTVRDMHPAVMMPNIPFSVPPAYYPSYYTVPTSTPAPPTLYPPQYPTNSEGNHSVYPPSQPLQPTSVPNPHLSYAQNSHKQNGNVPNFHSHGNGRFG